MKVYWSQCDIDLDNLSTIIFIIICLFENRSYIINNKLYHLYCSCESEHSQTQTPYYLLLWITTTLIWNMTNLNKLSKNRENRLTFREIKVSLDGSIQPRQRSNRKVESIQTPTIQLRFIIFLFEFLKIFLYIFIAL